MTQQNNSNEYMDKFLKELKTKVDILSSKNAEIKKDIEKKLESKTVNK